MFKTALGAAALGGLVAGTVAVLATNWTVLSGPARVIDGDTIVVQGIHVRLNGIDAPESAQLCGIDACGQAATAYMRRLVGNHTVICSRDATDRYGRTLGHCRVDGAGETLNYSMVRAGHAVAYRHYSTEYVEAEDAARQERLGLWGGANFEMPWQWRRDHHGERR